ncbi:MAG: hypothetical protein Q4F64_02855 [Corynebacterium casei]|nr:hypothetical protein [Corynebacterium casei]
MLAIGLAPPFASAQSERVVAVEDREAYVEEFNYDPNDPPVIDGVKGLTETEIAEYKQKIRQAEASGPPQDEIVAGQMWSDKVGIPEGVDKADADQSEVAIAKEQAQPQARSLRAAATQCKTFWLTPHRVCGAILNRYEALGGMASWLLLPIEGQKTNPDGQGTRQRFAGGFIYSHPTSGTHAVANHTANVWQRHGWEAGWLGYPTSGEVPVEGSTGIDGEINGWVQKFEGGQIYRTPVAQGFQVASINGLILEKWLETGGANGPLGFPTADEAKTADGIGRFSTFQWGSLYWSPATGAHPVYGPILYKWAASGLESGRYGYPTADIVGREDGSEYQEFQSGRIESLSIASDVIPYSAGGDGKEVGSNYQSMLECIGGRDTGRLTYFHLTGETLYCERFRHIYDRHLPRDISLQNWTDFQTCVAHTLLSSEPFEPNTLGTYGRTRYNTWTKTRSKVIVWSNSKRIHTAFTDGDGGGQWRECRHWLRT